MHVARFDWFMVTMENYNSKQHTIIAANNVNNNNIPSSSNDGSISPMSSLPDHALYQTSNKNGSNSNAYNTTQVARCLGGGSTTPTLRQQSPRRMPDISVLHDSELQKECGLIHNERIWVTSKWVRSSLYAAQFYRRSTTANQWRTTWRPWCGTTIVRWKNGRISL